MGILSKLKAMVLGETVDYKEMLESGAVIVDVRTPAEFKGGNAKGSINIPLQNLASKTGKLTGKEVILVCRSGARAERAKSILSQKGITAHNAGPWQTVAEL